MDAAPEGGQQMAVMLSLTVVGILVAAAVLALVIEVLRLSGQDVNWWEGAAVGALVGAGFAAAASLSHHLFAGFSITPWVLEGRQDIACLTAMGAILGPGPE